MLPFDSERPQERVVPESARFAFRSFALVWTGFAGLFFVFGLAFSLSMLAKLILAVNNGDTQAVENLGLFCLFIVPFVIVYECVCWWFFQTGLTVLHGSQPADDSLDADDQSKQSSREAE